MPTWHIEQGVLLVATLMVLCIYVHTLWLERRERLRILLSTQMRYHANTIDQPNAHAHGNGNGNGGVAASVARLIIVSPASVIAVNGPYYWIRRYGTIMLILALVDWIDPDG
jgi:hypothetical protein